MSWANLDTELKLQLALEPLQAGSVLIAPLQGCSAVMAPQSLQNAACLEEDVAVYQILSQLIGNFRCFLTFMLEILNMSITPSPSRLQWYRSQCNCRLCMLHCRQRAVTNMTYTILSP